MSDPQDVGVFKTAGSARSADNLPAPIQKVHDDIAARVLPQNIGGGPGFGDLQIFDTRTRDLKLTHDLVAIGWTL